MGQEREPLYIQIQNHFKQLISSRKLDEDDRIPTEKELIDQFQVSRITVANALADLANEGWIYRIPGRGSYVKGIPESYMRNSRGAAKSEVYVSQTPQIGLIFPSIEDFFAIQMVRGIRNALKNSKYSLHVMFTYNSKELEKEAIRELRSRVDGLIIFPVDAEVYNEEIIALKMENYPFVLLDRHLPGVETNVVLSDPLQGTILAVDYLWEQGHRNIAICSDTPMPTVTVEERIQGYNAAMKQKGALINPALILTDFSIQDAPFTEDYALFRFIKNKMATAYIALNCRLGVHIWSVARKLGLRVPEDISIITFDNPSPMLEEFSVFTFIDQNEEEMGFQAARTLLDILENPNRSPQYRKIILTPELVVNRTTSPEVS
ncbi:GntR family transcriptional regulator [Paenibacillus sp.]|jgi:GntR family transcriptional regulator of arabinose operon|uniref:GntR family transcriptional regulator n=1 Tax=Paenibacillus sp. TaxID=58172 RepID=UPI0028331E3A|nr:GntR family transcriptional regulator [Paenibacillus sp.]MDR0271613.1 GntR family transcriptional regulator [Paenibacillus sp.]